MPAKEFRLTPEMAPQIHVLELDHHVSPRSGSCLLNRQAIVTPGNSRILQPMAQSTDAWQLQDLITCGTVHGRQMFIALPPSCPTAKPQTTKFQLQGSQK